MSPRVFIFNCGHISSPAVSSHATGKALVDLVTACAASPYATPPPTPEAAPADDSGGVESDGSVDALLVRLRSRALLPQLGEALLDVWGRHAKSPRMAGPLLRTAELLASRTTLLEVRVTPPSNSGTGGGVAVLACSGTCATGSV